MKSPTKCLLGISILALFATTSAACGRTETAPITITAGKIERINGCHVKLDEIRGTIGDFHCACNVAESALKDEKWWGDQPQPLLFGMYVGDCLRLGKIFYCVEQMDAGKKSLTLKPTYEQLHWDGALLQRIKE